VPKDRSDDRHNIKGRLIRPMPPELWERLGEKVGSRERNKTISRLIAAYLDGTITLPDDKNAPLA
jgi:hypothetical protein